MTSKLSFKGEKKVKIKKKAAIIKRNVAKENERLFIINGKEIKQRDINIGKLSYGWTLLYPRDLNKATYSLINPESGKLPIIITFVENERQLCLSQTKSTTENASIKKSLKFTDDFELSPKEDIINFTEREISDDNKAGRIEPKNVDQVFILSDASTLFQSTKFITNEKKDTVYSIKSSGGEYVVFDPVANELKLSLTLTEYGLFDLSFELIDDIPHFRILFNDNKNQEKNTLVCASSGIPKVIPDPEDLLQPISRFILKLRREDAFITKEILKASHETSKSTNIRSGNNIDGQVTKTVMDLAKMGFKMNDKTIKEITDAYINGNLNQWLLDFKEKNITDRRT